MKKLIVIVLVICLYSCQYAQPISQEEREILQLQDQRSLGDGKLVTYLKNCNAQLRYRAAIALALGQIKTERAVNELFSAVAIEKDTNVSAGITTNYYFIFHS